MGRPAAEARPGRCCHLPWAQGTGRAAPAFLFCSERTGSHAHTFRSQPDQGYFKKLAPLPSPRCKDSWSGRPSFALGGKKKKTTSQLQSQGWLQRQLHLEPDETCALGLNRSCVSGSLRRKARSRKTFYFVGDEENAHLWVMSAHC